MIFAVRPRTFYPFEIVPNPHFITYEDPLKPLSSVGAHTKTVNGVCFDPYRENLLATFSEENVIKLWDIRKLKDPVLQLNTGSKVVQVGWCPTRGMGILASIGKDEKSIKLWDVKTGILVNDQIEDQSKSSSKRLGFLLGDYVEPKNMKSSYFTSQMS
jgi:WD40 repeat protein